MKGKKYKSPSRIHIMTYRFAVNVLTNCAMLLGNNFRKEKSYNIIHVLDFVVYFDQKCYNMKVSHSTLINLLNFLLCCLHVAIFNSVGDVTISLKKRDISKNYTDQKRDNSTKEYWWQFWHYILIIECPTLKKMKLSKIELVWK